MQEVTGLIWWRSFGSAILDVNGEINMSVEKTSLFLRASEALLPLIAEAKLEKKSDSEIVYTIIKAADDLCCKYDFANKIIKSNEKGQEVSR